MAKTTELTHRLYTLIYFVIIFVILAYCVLNAMYTVIIGGTTFYLFASFILVLQCIFALRTSLDSRIYASLGLVLLIVGLLYTHGLDFLSHLKAIVLIPALMLTLFGLDSLYKHPTRLMLLKIGLVMGLLLLAYSQYYELVELQNYYNSLHNGETWQQFGAL
ncbi:hypothetical protein FM020_10035 [Acinetobacter tandoii]|uniref:hypothetical protein n=1 Tax=Acinetobacter TaxID=469 RepID=UPI001158A07C|nr:hypothetical protein [Acinetobacter kanungonis]NCI77156.1 hypothetical protein [Acinetobacter kanungonis]QDK98206.1 hypothetical protein FM020_10035 [Acinetobacter tandoii]